MVSKLSETKVRLLLISVSILCFVFFLLLGEVMVRLFMPHVKLPGTDRHLVRDPAFGKTYGWVPDASGVSFSAPVHINHEGFRDLGGPAQADTSLLLIGDSVTFGVGVEADSSFAAMLQHAHPTNKVINAAAIGYSLEDYHELVDYLLPHNPTIRRVIIGYALNDFSRTLSQKEEQPPLLNLRGFFHEHSTLYILLKATFSDPSEDYFLYDYEFYAEPSPDLPNILELLHGLVEKIRSKGIECTVVILPYEYQLRMNDEGYRTPQRVITTYLSQHHIPFADALEDFKNGGGASRDYFLYGDYMHLSPKGHKVVFDLIESKSLAN